MVLSSIFIFHDDLFCCPAMDSSQLSSSSSFNSNTSQGLSSPKEDDLAIAELSSEILISADTDSAPLCTEDMLRDTEEVLDTVRSGLVSSSGAEAPDQISTSFEIDCSGDAFSLPETGEPLVNSLLDGDPDSSVKRLRSNGSSVQDGRVLSGFKTGSNQEIYIAPEKVAAVVAEAEKDDIAGLVDEWMNTQVEAQLEGTDLSEGEAVRVKVEAKAPPSSPASAVPSPVISKPAPVKVSKNLPLVPQKVHQRDESTEQLMAEVYQKVQLRFKREESGWIFEHFKWSWMHLYTTGGITRENAVEKTLEIMELKRKYERSILRRIVEGDEPSVRFMVLGVIDYTENHVELFDGFYSLKFVIDRNVYTLLRNSFCTLGSKLYVFGSELLVTPRSIFDITDPPLKLSYNSVKVCKSDCKLGKAKETAFTTEIASIRPDGGVVSALVVKVKEVLEARYFVSVENYKNRVDDPDEEVAKICELAAKTGYTITRGDITVSPYCKVAVEDRTGCCHLTWWHPHTELKVGERYVMLGLRATEWGRGLELVANKKSYIEKCK